KVDRSVTGLVAQQQCVGPLQTPLADCGVVASSHLATTGIATSCGEQPMKGLLDPAAMARLTVAESLTNIMWAKVGCAACLLDRLCWCLARWLVGRG
ncbi:unnamed protein product, partial [Hapterophycus canaliculatus]